MVQVVERIFNENLLNAKNKTSIVCILTCCNDYQGLIRDFFFVSEGSQTLSNLSMKLCSTKFYGVEFPGHTLSPSICITRPGFLNIFWNPVHFNKC